ncbi:MAG: isoprenylcysteine carboxylmethyltransferase family protein [Chloroflexi bacterium]|nr:isoprenylcysteine carboxylmethyltransferase family protein [Chloroflexota bacterium]
MPLLLKNLLFTLLVPGTVAVYVPLLIARGRSVTSQPPLLAAAVALIGLGAGIYAWCLWDFASFGRGTPLPLDAPKKLVVRGLYRFTRNPMYIGVLSVVLGWTALFATGALLIYAAVVAIVVHTFVVRYEEPKLRALFGTEYDAYAAQVDRWLPRQIWQKPA